MFTLSGTYLYKAQAPAFGSSIVVGGAVMEINRNAVLIKRSHTIIPDHKMRRKITINFNFLADNSHGSKSTSHSSATEI